VQNVLIALIASSTLALPVDSQRPGDVAVYGVGTASCGAWLEARAAKPSRLDIRVRQFETWLHGYLTAYNVFISGSPDVLKTDAAGMRAFVDKYCKDNPTAAFIAAANNFLVDQGGKLPPGER